MFRTEFLSTVWNMGRVEAEDLAILLNTTKDLVLSEAQHCAEQGWIRVLDSVILAVPTTEVFQS
ncbi:MAG TPA: hypothetical protein VJ824_16430 [Bacillota bacterium]|nr:hypothetical protein [Bacillota bacterium]